MSGLNPLPPLSDAEVAAGARPGESWEQARKRLSASRYVRAPVPCTVCHLPFWVLAHAEPSAVCPGCMDVLEWERDGDVPTKVAALAYSIAQQGESLESACERAARLLEAVCICRPCAGCDPDSYLHYGVDVGWVDADSSSGMCGRCTAYVEGLERAAAEELAELYEDFED